jgi:hypothetical protein
MERERTSAELIMYAHCICIFLGLSFGNTAKATREPVVKGGRSHVASYAGEVRQFNQKYLFIHGSEVVAAFFFL